MFEQQEKQIVDAQTLTDVMVNFSFVADSRCTPQMLCSWHPVVDTSCWSLMGRLDGTYRELLSSLPQTKPNPPWHSHGVSSPLSLLSRSPVRLWLLTHQISWSTFNGNASRLALVGFLLNFKHSFRRPTTGNGSDARSFLWHFMWNRWCICKFWCHLLLLFRAFEKWLFLQQTWDDIMETLPTPFLGPLIAAVQQGVLHGAKLLILQQQGTTFIPSQQSTLMVPTSDV